MCRDDCRFAITRLDRSSQYCTNGIGCSKSVKNDIVLPNLITGRDDGQNAQQAQQGSFDKSQLAGIQLVHIKSKYKFTVTSIVIDPLANDF